MLLVCVWAVSGLNLSHNASWFLIVFVSLSRKVREFYKVAIKWTVFGSNLWIVGTHGHYLSHTALPATTLLIARVTAAELIHKAATVTFNKPHIAWAIHTGRRLIETKRKKRRIPSSAQSAYTNESLNILPPWCIIPLKFKISALFHRQCY